MAGRIRKRGEQKLRQYLEYGMIMALLIAAFLILAHKSHAEPDESTEFSATQEQQEADQVWQDLDNKANADFQKKPTPLRAKKLPAKYFKGKMIDGTCACQCKTGSKPRAKREPTIPELINNPYVR